MHSADGRYVITFNGEIYNYRSIRRHVEAAGRCLRSDFGHRGPARSLRAGGVEAAIERTIGMFAFALWDRGTRA